VPEGEKEEVRQIYADKGFEGETLDAIVETVVADEQRWIDVMVQEEHGMSLNAGDPRMAGLVTFGAFFVAGAVPLVPFVVNWLAGEIIPSPFVVSAVLTALTFFITGALKSRIVALPWQREGFETLLVGGAAAGIAWLVGYLLRGIAV
jgi:VIT1/CCC1 family predicted Fe2+/Mn2+ transporter